jgi:hypothetical protein
MEIDMSLVREPWRGAKMNPPKRRPYASHDPDLKKARKKAQRKIRKGQLISAEGIKELWKPIEEWDDEELARGRPRDMGGGFRGRKPTWVTPEVHEAALDRFKLIIREGMNASTHKAIKVVENILENEEVDRRGKPIVSFATKFQAATFLIEHVLGKPKQHTEMDISVKLQGILANSIITPGVAFGELAEAYEDAEVVEDEEEEND